VKKALQKEIKERYDQDVTVKDTDNLELDLGLDSLDRVEIWLGLEERFKINIPEDEAKKMLTVKDCIRLVEKYKK